MAATATPGPLERRRFHDLPFDERCEFLQQFSQRLRVQRDNAPTPRVFLSDIIIIAGAHFLLLGYSYFSNINFTEFRPLIVVAILSALLLLSRPISLWLQRKALTGHIDEITEQLNHESGT